MKFLAALLISVSLVVGLIGAVTAYVPKVSSLDPASDELTLAAPAGIDPADPTRPLLTPADLEGGRLTVEAVERLRSATPPVERVRVKEFSFFRWTGKWFALLGVVGLIAGAVIMRRVRAKEIAMSIDDRHATRVSAVESLVSARQSIADIQGGLPRLTRKDERERAIMDGLAELQRTHLTAFVDARTELLGRYGMGGYAQIMDRFAGAERQVNRAWSAAADGDLEEARMSLDRAADRFDETVARLNQV